MPALEIRDGAVDALIELYAATHCSLPTAHCPLPTAHCPLLLLLPTLVLTLVLTLTLTLTLTLVTRYKTSISTRLGGYLTSGGEVALGRVETLLQQVCAVVVVLRLVEL